MGAKREQHKLVLTNRRKKAEFVKYVKRDSASYSLYVLRQCVPKMQFIKKWNKKITQFLNTENSLIIICIGFHMAQYFKQFLATYQVKRALAATLNLQRLGRAFHGV